MDILFLEPVFKERIWGGQKLKTSFGYDLPYEKTGECWAISAHPNGSSVIKNGRFKGRTLEDVYQHDREFFNHMTAPRFPLLTKILDANDDLSVQVHPDDAYAKTYENDLGKTECWVVLEADQDAKIIYGHRAKTKEELKKMIDHHEFKELLIEKKVKKGDFIYVPSGTIHALGKGLLILETQQSSDTTYRLYDYDRKDDLGHTRELHLSQSIEVTRVPHVDSTPEAKVLNYKTSTITRYVSNEFFTVERWSIKDELSLKSNHFKLMSVIDGEGTLNGERLKKGDHLIVIGSTYDLELRGKMDLIVSWT
ncbi:MAG: mannose-6-phosphate isomerase, class I [Acholeplasmataceae bacterium]|jgi:mannose-6-phosphate isomerase|nr:mannose-6-phosphate isomerase, class I [Acholeplasmataceae bacterium]